MHHMRIGFLRAGDFRQDEPDQHIEKRPARFDEGYGDRSYRSFAAGQEKQSEQGEEEQRNDYLLRIRRKMDSRKISEQKGHAPDADRCGSSGLQ